MRSAKIDRKQFVRRRKGELWDGFELCCRDGAEWRIGKKISEKSRLAPAQFSSTGNGKAEAQAVYHCEQIIRGKPTGTKAVAKVRMQVPPDYPLSLSSVARAKIAEEEPAGWSRLELQSLRYFNEKKCKVVPRLLNVVRSWQDGRDMPVPNGYLVFLVIEEVPGMSLIDFWEYDRPKRDKIRAAFRRSLTEQLNLHAHPSDCKLDNLVYDERTDKCYFVDFESIRVKEEKPPLKFADYHYFLWGLAYTDYCDDYF
ncbi:hypothetical protein AJ80_05070 [Polytolypa hystricis UAMH7299]|uniref:Protein kinase domain-containing protein n=1 Tax=Polytolypa hystricis (strain UAMH7299) TaxID=1447883 RepID=A0A2B7Y6C4_POLH7|nr:hypothetical protein AJ80_05070 [Polytolypa hystricis UAMH7299]